MDVLSVFPMLVAQNMDRTIYRGLIDVFQQTFHVCIVQPGKDKLSEARIDCDWKLQQLLQGYESIIKQRLQQSSSMANFLVEFKAIIEHQLINDEHCGIHLPTHFYQGLIGELEQIGWNRLVYVDPSFQEIHLQAEDAMRRSHVIKIKLHAQHPNEAPSCITNLPASFDYIPSKMNAIQSLYSQFVKCLTGYQDFWDVMDDIDLHSCVLEPEKPTRGAINRRIALGNNASLQVEVDPKHPRMFPVCRFLGADHVVGPLKESMNHTLQHWDPQRMVLENLEDLLGIKFPSPSNTKKEDFSADCGICYSYRLDGDIPDQVCDDSRCGQPFHQTCLYEWLRALPTSRQSFNTIFGECPYCNKVMMWTENVKDYGFKYGRGAAASHHATLHVAQIPE